MSDGITEAYRSEREREAMQRIAEAGAVEVERGFKELPRERALCDELAVALRHWVAGSCPCACCVDDRKALAKYDARKGKQV